ncbi:AAA family ATPase [Dactylosporangium sp. NPDC005572]|uniref:AAA family ATPase n=1 Tax=Dactylosporangium sp. NPDC005572 TaxID=3156889 RepID=UPI0033A01E05
MADLIQIRVKNFRAFREAGFDLPTHGLVLVTGQNNAGKSALLSAPRRRRRPD